MYLENLWLNERNQKGNFYCLKAIKRRNVKLKSDDLAKAVLEKNAYDLLQFSYNWRNKAKNKRTKDFS